LYGLYGRLLWVTGLRVTEALSIRPIDLRQAESAVVVPWQKRGYFKERIVYVEPDTFKLLEAYAKTLPSEDRLFPWSKQYAAFIMRTAQQGIGLILRRYGNHAIRHSFCSFLYNNRVPMASIQRAMGHTSSKTTAIYSHLTTASYDDDIKRLSF
jgi:integrase/recombinase XerD